MFNSKHHGKYKLHQVSFSSEHFLFFFYKNANITEYYLTYYDKTRLCKREKWTSALKIEANWYKKLLGNTNRGSIYIAFPKPFTKIAMMSWAFLHLLRQQIGFFIKRSSKASLTTLRLICDCRCWSTLHCQKILPRNSHFRWFQT